MAIQLSKTVAGRTSAEAYAKVRSIEINYAAQTAAIFVDYYNSAAQAPKTSGNAGGMESGAEAFAFTRHVVENGIDGEGNLTTGFDDYFADSKLKVSGGSPAKKAYEAAKAQDSDLAGGVEA